MGPERHRNQNKSQFGSKSSKLSATEPAWQHLSAEFSVTSSRPLLAHYTCPFLPPLGHRIKFRGLSQVHLTSLTHPRSFLVFPVCCPEASRDAPWPSTSLLLPSSCHSSVPRAQGNLFFCRLEVTYTEAELPWKLLQE